MAVVVFLRGVNVGGHRKFRPSVLAKQLSEFNVVNIGAAGTFVVRKPGSTSKFRAELLRRLPFEAHVMICDAADILRLETEHPFGKRQAPADMVRFVSVLAEGGGLRRSLPAMIPTDDEWFVRVIACKDCFVFGEYRRHMKTIGYLGQVDKLFDAPATTRNWNTIAAIIRALKAKPVKSP